jgi:outer membrane protein TolC
MKVYSVLRAIFILALAVPMSGRFLAIATPAAQELSATQQATADDEIPVAPVVPEVEIPPLPESPVERAEREGTALRLSLKDLTKLALQNNLDIAISETNEQLFQQKIIQAHGAYDPAVIVGLGVSSQERPNTNLTNRSSQGTSNKTDFANWNFQFVQNLPNGGGVTALYNSNRSDTNQQFALFSPQYNANTQIQFTQPLRRNFRIDQTRTTIRLANLDIKTNDSQFKQKVVDTISTIQTQYWDLVGAIRDYEIKRESVRLAQITLRNNRMKVEIGTLAPIGITEAQADMASREVDLIAAEEKIDSMENALRALISSDRNGDIWSQTIVPTESPEFREYPVRLDEAIDSALTTRPELEQLSIKLQQLDLNYQMNQNLKKWQLDLVGSFGSQGVAGPQTLNAQGLPLIDSSQVGGVGTAYRNLFTGGFLNWSIGFNVQIPLRARAAEAQLGQIQVQRRQQLMNRKNLEQQIQVEIRNAVRKLETNKKQIETARVARKFAAEQLDGEEKRFDAGMSENFRVLDRQRGLSAAQGVELQSLIAYKKSIISLQRAMYTLLESNDFDIAKGNGSSVPDLK